MKVGGRYTEINGQGLYSLDIKYVRREDSYRFWEGIDGEKATNRNREGKRKFKEVNLILKILFFFQF